MGEKSTDRTLDKFLALVKDSVDGHAKRKGYTDNDVDGFNKLAAVTAIIGIQRAHAVGECIYKLVEYLKTPREVLLIKVAGWSYILWKEHKDEQ